jgi:RsiW-degrading membrane proteinase PrsW (M82 family)
MKKYFVVFTSLSISHPWNQPILPILIVVVVVLNFAPLFYFATIIILRLCHHEGVELSSKASHKPKENGQVNGSG